MSAIPTPESGIVRMGLAAFEVITIVPDLLPVPVGEKVGAGLQEEAGAIVVIQEVDVPKSAAFGPVNVML